MIERKELIERLRDATEGPRMLMGEAADMLEADAPAIPKTWHLVGYYHKAESADECDFYFKDVINDDCPDCHPCYADTAALEKPAPAVPQEPVRNDMSIQLLERLIKTLTNLGYATPEGGIEAFNADLPTQLYHLCFGVDRVLSALKTVVPQGPVAWQPIETAPKDGSRVLLWWDGAVREGWCAGAGKSRDGGDWWRSHSLTVCAGRPTQWMPLPPAPEGAPAKSPVLTDTEMIQAIEHRFAPSPHPQRPRLTDEEIEDFADASTGYSRMVDIKYFARAIEKKVRGEA